MPQHPCVAVLIPCYNEELTIANVIYSFKTMFPDAIVYVYDNNSTDKTQDQALKGGAIVRTETQQGKGHVVRRMFADIDADVYVLIDGDNTYDVTETPTLIDRLIKENLDMISGVRQNNQEKAYRLGHKLGNNLLTGIVSFLFGRHIADMLSGYRIFSRRFVKSFPMLSTGFEIETELTIHAMQLNMPILESNINYRSRPEGSISKLHTFKDGWRILLTIIRLLKDEKPVLFFTTIFFISMIISIVLAWPIFTTYMKTGLVPRFPTAILATGITILGFLSLAIGLILDTVTRGRKEAKRMTYLSYPSPSIACQYRHNPKEV